MTGSDYTSSRKLSLLLAELRTLIVARQTPDGDPMPPALRGRSALERDDDVRESVTEKWDPQAVDQRIDQLTNGRWLTRWKRTGEELWRLPLIDEIDQTGVDRHRIASLVSPDRLAQIEAEARRARASNFDHVLSFQHHLIQQLQQAVTATDQGLQNTRSAPRAWHVGDTVRYCGDLYTIVTLTPQKLTCESQTNGGFDIRAGGPEMAKLRLVRPAPSDDISCSEDQLMVPAGAP